MAEFNSARMSSSSSVKLRYEKCLLVWGNATYRVLYVAKFSEAVYVLHAFVKKTQKTSKKDLDLATERYKALIRARNAK